MHNVPKINTFVADACEVASHGQNRNNKIKGSVGASWQALFINLTGCEDAMTNITSMMENGANITVAITLEDLRRFHQEVIADTKKELEAQIAEDRGERYLSIKQVCEMLDVDPSSLWRWRKRGYLVPAEIGGKRRYKMSDIRRILNGRAAQ